MRYRPRNTPELEARQWRPGMDQREQQELAAWCDGWFFTGDTHGHTTPPWQHHTCLSLETAGDSKGHADPGDWIIRVGEDDAGDGIYHVLSDEEFQAQFEPVLEDEGCSCCQALNRDEAAPDAECPRCGHLNKNHGGAP